MGIKLTQDEVEKIFSDKNCSFDDIYINNSTPHNYTCECGNKSLIRIKDFKKGHRCLKCSGKEKPSYEEVYNYFKDKGCGLLETEYINNKTKMKYKCECGEKSSITFGNFKHNDQRCRKCSGKEKHSYDNVYKTFKDRGCQLLETEYINIDAKMRYICECGNESEINFKHFKNNHRCKECGIEKMFGENNPNWNPNREEVHVHDRIRLRKSRKWIIKNMKTDPLYQEYLVNPPEFHLDHIIPVSLFSKLVVEYNLGDQQIKKIINKRKNLQLLTRQENSSKHAKGSLQEAKQFLLEHGIQLED